MFVAGGAMAVTASPQAEVAATPAQLFSRLLPAIRHARCTNCHDIVDPVSGLDHVAGVKDDQVGRDRGSCRTRRTRPG